MPSTAHAPRDPFAPAAQARARGKNADIEVVMALIGTDEVSWMIQTSPRFAGTTFTSISVSKGVVTLTDTEGVERVLGEDIYADPMAMATYRSAALHSTHRILELDSFSVPTREYGIDPPVVEDAPVFKV